jgi:hypothetical protein
VGERGRSPLTDWPLTDAGERRSVVEIQVEEVGPSLWWATAKVERVRSERPAGVSKGGQFTDEPPF